MADLVVEGVVYIGRRVRGQVSVVKTSPGQPGQLLWIDPAWTGGALIELDWGSSGPGTELLALGMLTDLLGTVDLGRLWASDFYKEVLFELKRDNWAMHSHAICAWLVLKTVAQLQGVGDHSADGRLAERVFGWGCGGAAGAGQGGGGVDAN